MNGKSIIELDYHKISWFVSVSLPVISASANNLQLATDKSWYFAQTRPIIDKYFINRFSKNVQAFPKSNTWSTGSLWLSARLSAWTRRSVGQGRGSWRVWEECYHLHPGICFKIAEIFKWLAKCLHGYLSSHWLLIRSTLKCLKYYSLKLSTVDQAQSTIVKRMTACTFYLCEPELVSVWARGCLTCQHGFSNVMVSFLYPTNFSIMTAHSCHDRTHKLKCFLYRHHFFAMLMLCDYNYQNALPVPSIY